MGDVGAEAADAAADRDGNLQLFGRYLRQEGRVVFLREGKRIEQLFVAELAGVDQKFAVRFLIVGYIQLSVDDHEAVVGVVAVDEHVLKPGERISVPAVCRSDDADLVILSIAVQIVLLYGLEELVELVGGGRAFHIQRFEEILADPCAVGVCVAIVEVERGDAIETAVGALAVLQNLRRIQALARTGFIEERALAGKHVCEIKDVSILAEGVALALVQDAQKDVRKSLALTVRDLQLNLLSSV